MSEHNSEESSFSENKNLSEYEKIIQRMRDVNEKNLNATTFVNALYDALIKAGFEPKEARSKILRDCYGVWAQSTIDKQLPPESKDLEAVEEGKLGREKQLATTKGSQTTVTTLNPARRGGGKPTTTTVSDNENKLFSETFWIEYKLQIGGLKRTIRLLIDPVKKKYIRDEIKK